MLRMLTSLVLVSFLFAIPAQMQNTVKQLEKARESAARIAAEGDHIGEVKFKSGDRQKGRISSVGADSFTLSDLKGSNSQTVSFTDVDSIKKLGKGLGKGLIIGIVAAGVGAAILFGLLLERCRNELGCGAGQ